MCHAVPFRRFTCLMIRSVVESAVNLLNLFPSKNGISDQLGPVEIVEGRNKLDLSQNSLEFGAYAMVYLETKNDMKNRSVPGIALRASNDASGFYFMSLYSVERLHAYNWKEVPIDKDVIARVEDLAMQDQQPLNADNHHCFKWMPKRQIKINDDDSEIICTTNQPQK